MYVELAGIRKSSREKKKKKPIKCRQTSHCQGRKDGLAAKKTNGSGSSLVCRHHSHLQPVFRCAAEWIPGEEHLYKPDLHFGFFCTSSKGISGPEELLYLLLLATVWVQLVQAVWCLASGGTQGKLKQNSSPLGKTLNVPSLEGRDCSWRKSPSGHRQRMCCVTARTANSQQSQTRAITLQLKRNFFS